MPIFELDPETIGQIAAGEVIERPASVVKELVENAVDAGATRVTVSIERGGSESIEVVDDGDGIPPEELPLAVRRYATSKLRAAVDLESVATLGFRGEGLASIAAVANMDVVSRRPGSHVGYRIQAHGERASEVEPIAAPPGTRVRTTDLFFNVPVRREYLRSPGNEFGRISSWLSSFALAYPQTTFVLRHDGSDVWIMPGTADARERLAMVFGRNAAQELLPLDAAAAASVGGKVAGFVSAPGSDRPDRRMQLLFVNGRLLRGAALAGAWSAGYSTYAMSGRHPYGVLFLELPPDHIDPNVHPTKSDVRLRYATQVFDGVRRSIAATLAADATRRFRERSGGISLDGISASPPLEAGAERAVPLFERAGDEPVVASGLRIAGQLQRTYIVAFDGDDLVLVDQHAAHERIAYEQIVERAASGAPSEPLLVPHVVELDAARAEFLEQSLEALQEGGLTIEPFGDRAFRIVSTPAGYGARPFDVSGFLDDIGEPRQRNVRERVWASLACHSVTVAGERLETAEMATLVERLQHCANPMHCPHGRPTMVRLAPDAVARMFKR
jgi:DNA mismatch repair protein MutL